MRARGLVPFLDIAYQGFGDGIDADAVVVREFAATPGPLFVSSSFSKSFSLYGERVGAFTVVDADKDEAARVLSQVKRVVRANYSNPPTHGGQIVAPVLATRSCARCGRPSSAACASASRMRESLVEKLRERVPGADFGFMRAQRGMFSYSGLRTGAGAAAARRVLDLRVDTGRICVAALNSRNVEYVARRDRHRAGADTGGRVQLLTHRNRIIHSCRAWTGRANG